MKRLIKQTARHIFEKLSNDIRGRIGYEWGQIDDDVMNDELRPEWERLIKKELEILLKSAKEARVPTTAEVVEKLTI